MMARRAMTAAVLILAVALPATGDSDEWRLTPDGWVSGPVEHVATINEETGTAVDATLHDDHLYVTTWRSFSIYDVSDPANPERLSTTPLGPYMYSEQPQTNGEILLLSNDLQWSPAINDVPMVGGVEPVGADLDIYDVRDKSAPKLIGSYQSTQRDHLWTCVLDCAYAYSAFGTIVDLSDPANPTPVGDWTQAQRPRLFHHVTEVEPGVVLTGSVPMLLLDAREDPLRPTVLASTSPETTKPPRGLTPESIPARVRWPRETRDRFALVSMETPFSTQCSDQSGPVLTFDTTRWDETGTFTPAGRYQITENGTYPDGKSPYNALGCSSYGLAAHPQFADGGLAAVSFFEHGTRVLHVDDQGQLHEIGGFLPAGGNATAPVWLSDELLYVVDLHRGIDILRVTPGAG